MTATYDVTTDAGYLRLLITDTDVGNAIFEDAEIDAFLSRETNDVRYAAAAALEVIAASEVLVQKRIRLLDITTDGPAEARELRELAKSLREQAAQSGGEPTFDIAEFVTDDFSARERRWKQVQRSGL